ncbi:hypothetical protein LTR24_002210 [Lithohypha guttulata]|uniref:Malic acid transport protein n=1 Tax=Lithohypha guttulata TaxID=1690604 RepID=A0ABR0KK16_9EURO|nr:hypothetical protein LTR24_002210 [Lithohypha guttulata]
MPQFKERVPHPEKAKEPPNDIDEDSPRKAGLRDRIAHFTWIWFACTMSTGAVAVCITQTPNRFPGLDTIGVIFYIVDLVLFVTFLAAITTRFIMIPKKFIASLHHPVEGLFFGSFWVSVALILNGMQAYGVPHTGPWLIKALEVMYWIYCAVVLLVGIFHYFFFFKDEKLNVANALPAWIFPIYPLLVVGPLAGTLIPSQPHTAAYPMWVGAVMLQGLAWTVSLLMYAIYTQRLMVSVLPAAPTRPGMYVSVGPAGYTSAGLISLGLQAPLVLSPNTFGTTDTNVAELVKVLGIMAGIFLLLFAFWFFCVSTLAVVSGLKEMTFTLNWWAFIFPNGGLTLGAIQMGRAFNSPGVNGICSALTIMLVVLWLVVAVFNIKALWQGSILWPGKDEDKDIKGISWGRAANTA